MRRADILFDLELKNLTKRFGSLNALNGISLEIKAGHFVSLLGPSGCGKTTALRIIAGFEPATSGSIFIRGKCVDKLPAFLRPVNTVFQNYALFPHLSVWENVAFGLKVKRYSSQKISTAVGEALEMVRLSAYGGRRPHELSGGQQQRVALARALINEPTILLLDEPLGALDLNLRKALQVELRRVHRDLGITFVFVTHDQEEAMMMSDVIVVMDAGNIVQVGTPEEIYQRPSTPFVNAFVGNTNFFEGAATSLGNGTCRIDVGDWTFSRSGPAPGSAVTVGVRPEDIVLGQGIAGVVDDVIYLGARVHVLVKLDNSRGVQVELSGAGTQEIPKVGSRTAVSWAGDKCTIFPSRDKVL